MLFQIGSMGGSHERMFVSIAALIVGEIVLGFGSHGLVLPFVDSVTGFILQFAVIAAVAAWVATSSPRLSYAGTLGAMGFFSQWSRALRRTRAWREAAPFWSILFSPYWHFGSSSTERQTGHGTSCTPRGDERPRVAGTGSYSDLQPRLAWWRLAHRTPYSCASRERTRAAASSAGGCEAHCFSRAFHN